MNKEIIQIFKEGETGDSGLKMDEVRGGFCLINNTSCTTGNDAKCNVNNTKCPDNEAVVDPTPDPKPADPNCPKNSET